MEQKVSRVQLEIWLNDHVTQTYLKSFQWHIDRISREVGDFSFVDSDNNKSMNNLYSAMGAKEGFISAIDPGEFLLEAGMLEVKK